MCYLEYVQLFQVLVNFTDVWPLGDIDFEALSSVDLGNQEEVCESNFVANAVLALSVDKQLLESAETSDYHPLYPGNFLVVAKSYSNFCSNASVLNRLCACVNLFTQSSDLPFLNDVVGEKFGQVRVHLFEVLANGQTF